MALCLAVSVMLAWVQNTGKEKFVLLQEAFFIPSWEKGT